MKTFHSMRMRYPALIAVLLFPALSLQALTIASCSSTFNANIPGATYTVTANLVGPLSGSGPCINVTQPNITINLNNFILTGTPGPTIGISISTAATGVQVLGPGKIRGFRTGILDLGSSAWLKSLTVVHNTQTGVLMDTVTNSTLIGSYIVQNGGNGVVLRNTSNCKVEQSPLIAGNGNGTQGYGIWIENSGSVPLSTSNVVFANLLQNANYPNTQVAGIWVGSSNTAPIPGCSPGTPSKENQILNNQVDANVIVGIGLQCDTASSNTVRDNTASLNTLDGADGTASCTGDTWTSNTFTTKFQPCD
jgi:hypothetical protein